MENLGKHIKNNWKKRFPVAESSWGQSFFLAEWLSLALGKAVVILQRASLTLGKSFMFYNGLL